MKRTLKKAMSILFAVVMIFGIIGNTGYVKISAATITDYEVGDIIEFGWYPQSEVKDEALIAELNKADGEWISYGYYSGTGDWDDGKMKPDDYMCYKDVVLGTNKYRSVLFDSYRPNHTGGETTTDGLDTYQDDNGYTYGNVYWFKYEPIEWRVLDPDTGMVMSETVIDSQEYNNYIIKNIGSHLGRKQRANNYAYSSIREWLNDDFYNVAFSADEQNVIEYMELDNSACSDSLDAYGSESTYDKIYLLSYDDALNMDYGFGSSSDRATGSSEYAKCQGVLDKGNYSDWWLRTSGRGDYYACSTYNYGDVRVQHSIVSYSYIGVRPAMNLNTIVEIKNSEYAVLPEIIEEDFIKKPSTSKINYGDTLILHTDSSKIPADATIEWSVEGDGVTIEPSADGKTCSVISEATGDVKIIAKYVDADGVEHVAEQEIKSNASIWQKIISFFKNLFGMNRIIEQ